MNTGPKTARARRDSATDIGAARNAGLPSVAVSFGYCDGRVEDLGADIVIEDFRELPAAAGRLLAPGRLAGERRPGYIAAPLGGPDA